MSDIAKTAADQQRQDADLEPIIERMREALGMKPGTILPRYVIATLVEAYEVGLNRGLKACR